MLHHGDCIEVMAGMEPESVDAIVTDPPYSIGFMGRKWDQHKDEDAAFGYWLAGFTDGEGHFRVQGQSRGTYSCAFAIQLRRDDRAILERVQKFLGCGSISEWTSEERHPMVRLNVQAKADCLRVVEVFTRYPLRAKKLRDFLPWAEAVVEWNGMERGHRWRGKGDWSRLEALKLRVESARAYRDIPWSGHGYQDWSREWGEVALRVLKPGGYMLAMGGTRTYHRMVTGLEDAGFEIRDCLVYGYASGFPKSKASLKPAWEPIVMARKPGPLRMLNIDECRIPMSAQDAETIQNAGGFMQAGWQGPDTGIYNKSGDVSVDATVQSGRWPANIVLTDPIFDGGIEGVVGGGEAGGGFGVRGGGMIGDWNPTDRTEYRGQTIRGGGEAVGYGDSGTYSRFFLVPKSSRSDREPVLDEYAYQLHKERGECVVTRRGRVIAAGTTADVSASSTTSSGSSTADPSQMVTRSTTSTATSETTGSPTSLPSTPSPTSASIPGASSVMARGGSRARSVESSSLLELPIGTSPLRDGPSTDDADPATSSGWSTRNVCGRCGKPLPRFSTHPTQKPTDLMRHLVRLVTPTGGVVLDPFLGSGTTALAAEMEGFQWVGIERELEYVEIARARLNGVQRGLGLEAS